MPRSPARSAAALVALLALLGLVLQFVHSGTQPGLADPLLRLWVLARYFTILTNALVALTFALVALGPPPGQRMVPGVLLAIGMVGIVYHWLLAPAVPFAGLEYWADLVLHTLVPLAVAGWWLVWGDRDLSLRQIPFWLLWPLVYCAYALVRGGTDGRYPYFFLDIGQFGAPRVALNVAGLCLGFALAGAVLVALGRLMGGMTRTAGS